MILLSDPNLLPQNYVKGDEKRNRRGKELLASLGIDAVAWLRPDGLLQTLASDYAEPKRSTCVLVLECGILAAVAAERALLCRPRGAVENLCVSRRRGGRPRKTSNPS